MSKERNNLTVKIFALIIAIILWSYVMSEENPTVTREFTIPVGMNNLSSLEDSGILLVEPKEPTIEIEISGKRNTLNKLDKRDILATVDLEGSEEGVVKLPIEVELPDDIRIVRVTPREMSFKFEKIISKEVVIEVETRGDLPRGYTLGDPEVVPQSLYVEGGRSWIESLDKAVVRIDLSNRTEDISLNTPIHLLDADGSLIREVEKDRNTVDVFIPVHQTKLVPIELDIINKSELGRDIRLGLKPNSVEIIGKKELLDKIGSIKTKPIDLREIYSGMIVPLEVPDKIHLVTKEEIKLIVNPQTEENAENANKLETRNFRYSAGDIRLIGLKEGLKLDEETLGKTVEVTIEGSKDVLNSIDEDDLDIQIDLTDLGEGEYNVTPMVPAKPGITLARINPKDLKIRLVEED